MQAGSLHTLIADAKPDAEGIWHAPELKVADINDEADEAKDVHPEQVEKLRALLSSSLKKKVASLGLCLTILLKGPSLYQMLKIVKAVADSLGTNFLQVSHASLLFGCKLIRTA